MNTLKINSNLLSSFLKNEFKGHDPFDYLNSKIFHFLPLKNNNLLKLIFTQIGKKSIFNFRKFLLIPKSRNPKGLALVILGLLEDYKRTNDNYYLVNAGRLVEWLIENTCDQNKWKYKCWGYNFEWQARAFNVPRGTPNIVTTYFVSLAIYRYSILKKDLNLKKLSLNSAYFMRDSLITSINDNYVFNYVPNYDVFVHNANLFGAYWCLLCGTENNDTELIDKSLSAINFTVKNQKENGSWVYGLETHHQWIDSFHTGYNLEILSNINKILNNTIYSKAIIKGYKYYINEFIMDDGRIKYFNNSVFPLDVHSYSQAIILIRIFDPNNFDLLNKVVKNLVKEMYIEKKKRFRYQKNKYYVNNINYFRWTQAWAYYSLSIFNNLTKKNI